MKVTSVGVMDTHAIVGGHNVRSFGMSDSPEFFTVLSSTLYSLKRLAVIREVLCNAWDAHIASGIKDVPVKVTITNDKITIRDYGTGIPDDLMVPIYCIYGGSTKLDSEKENGGFGFGSKAPFAYTNHFTVTSMHEGLKTVYAVSRGSKDSLGKPDLRPLVSMDTEESGLEVVVPLGMSHHRDEFEQLVKVVTATGDMHVQLNGEILNRLPYNEITNNYILCKRPVLIPNSNSGIYVRLGTVIYPVQDDEEYTEEFATISQLVKHSTKDEKMAFIILTEPNTITITPSRESVEMTDSTKAHIKKLLQDAIATFDNKIENIYSDMVQNSMKEVGESGDIHKALKLIDKRDIRKLFEHMNQYTNKDYFVEPDDILKVGLTRHAASSLFRSLKSKIDLGQEDEMIIGNLIRYFPAYKEVFRNFQNIGRQIRRNYVQSPRHLHDTSSETKERIESKIRVTRRKFWNSSILNILKKAVGPENVHRLGFIMSDDAKYNYQVHWKFRPLIHFDEMLQVDYGSLNKYLDPVDISMAYNRIDINDVETNCPERKSNFLNMLAIVVLRGGSHDDDMIKAIQGVGFNVIDNCYQNQSNGTKVVKKKIKGYVPIEETFASGSIRLTTNFDFDQENLNRVEKPKHVFYRKIEKGEHRVYGFSKYSDLTLITKLIDGAVLVPASRTAQSLVDKGIAKDGLVSLYERVKEIHDKDPDNFALLYKARSNDLGQQVKDLIDLCKKDSLIASLSNLSFSFSDDVINAVSMLSSCAYSSSMDYEYRKPFSELESKLKLDQNTFDAIEAIKTNRVLSLIRVGNITSSLQNEEQQLYKKQRALLIEALKG